MKKSLCIVISVLFVLLSSLSAFGFTYEEWAKEYNANKEKTATQPTKQDLEECYTLGTTDGAKQLYLDNVYMIAYKQGFSDAVSDCFLEHPLLAIALNRNDKEFLKYDLQSSTSSVAYKTIRLENFNGHRLEGDTELYDSYCKGYDYSYQNENIDTVASIVSLTESQPSEIDGYNDGYSRFNNDNLMKYKEQYPTESFFTATYFFYVVVALLLIVIIICAIHKRRKPKNQKER